MAATVARTEGQQLDGTLKVWNIEKGFGFATMDDGGPDLFVHQSSITVEGDRYRAIMPGTQVSCTYYLREGKETARECVGVKGKALPGFASKLEATQKLSIIQGVAGRAGMCTGNVKFMNKEKGFGFIVPDAGGEDVFVHVGDIAGQQLLEQGEPVSYTTAVKKGTRSQAVNVTPLRPQVRYPPFPQQAGFGGYPPAPPVAYGAPPPQQQAYDHQYSYGPPQPQHHEGYGGHQAYVAPPQTNYGGGEGGVCGKIKWFNIQKQFGFIVPDHGGPDMYFKGADVLGSQNPPLAEHDPVTYQTKTAGDGKQWAVSVARARGGAGLLGGAKRKSPEGQQDAFKRPAPYQQPGPQYVAPYTGAPPQAANPQYGAPAAAYPAAAGGYGAAPRAGAGSYGGGQQQYGQGQYGGSPAQYNGAPQYGSQANGGSFDYSPY